MFSRTLMFRKITGVPYVLSTTIELLTFAAIIEAFIFWQYEEPINLVSVVVVIMVMQLASKTAKSAASWVNRITTRERMRLAFQDQFSTWDELNKWVAASSLEEIEAKLQEIESDNKPWNDG